MFAGGICCNRTREENPIGSSNSARRRWKAVQIITG